MERHSHSKHFTISLYLKSKFVETVMHARIVLYNIVMVCALLGDFGVIEAHS